MDKDVLLQRVMQDRTLAGTVAIVMEQVEPWHFDTTLLLGVLPGVSTLPSRLACWLIFVGQVLCTRPDLRLVLLSTTAHAAILQTHFGRFSPQVVKGEESPKRRQPAHSSRNDLTGSTPAIAATHSVDPARLKLHAVHLSSCLSGPPPLFKHVGKSLSSPLEEMTHAE